LEFGDFECPACRGFYQAEKEVLPHHASDVALYFRHWPLPYHRFAYPSARAAECAADQGKFAEYHNMLYEHQDSLGLISFDDFANRAKVPDLEKFGKCVRQTGRVAAIDSGSALAMRIGAQGTPAIIFNGILLSFTPDSARLEMLIREAVNTKN
jgi:protein-disulfide isomerase